MNKKLIIAIVIIAILEVTGSVVHLLDLKPELPDKELVYLQLGAKGEEFALRRLEGCDREDLIEKWGAPNGMLCGLYGDIWNVSETGSITVYYSLDSKVEHLLLTQTESN